MLMRWAIIIMAVIDSKLIVLKKAIMGVVVVVLLAIMIIIILLVEVGVTAIIVYLINFKVFIFESEVLMIKYLMMATIK